MLLKVRKRPTVRSTVKGARAAWLDYPSFPIKEEDILVRLEAVRVGRRAYDCGGAVENRDACHCAEHTVHGSADLMIDMRG